jgi:hypothetical protein
MVALAIASTGCASQPAPTDHLASALAAVRGAQEAGAGQVPKAALQLELAQEQVAQARAMIKQGQNERADYMTVRAFNDAELATALARQHQAEVTLANATEQTAAADGAPAGTQPMSPATSATPPRPQKEAQ